MLISQALLNHAIAKAREIAEYQKGYALNGDATCKSTADLIWIVASYLQREILVVEIDIPADSSSIRAFVVSYPKNYEICMLAEKNFCWKRFVLCKEIFQVILDDDRYRNPDVFKQLEETSAAIAELMSSPRDHVQSEILAELASLEFMFPFSDRVKILEQNKGREIDYLAIAERYKIPRVMVERVLGAPMMEMFTKLFAE